MKKTITLLGASCFVLLSQAQTFSDNFDSYTAGSYLGPQSGGAWTTWSNTPGTSEDVLVSNADAMSGANSLHFTSTSADGGPTDLIRHFGVLNTGQFSMEFNMKVGAGKAAYFNLQKTLTLGQIYSLSTYFLDNGTLLFDGHPEFEAIYPQGTWFNFRIDIDFNLNRWEIFFDDVSQGYFWNEVNQIESIDIFPVDTQSPYNADFFIDDFSTTVTPYSLPSVNAGVSQLGVAGANLAGNTVAPSFAVRNLGTTAITSFDITASYNGIDIPQSFTGVSLASLAQSTFTLSSDITLVQGTNDLTITVSNVNGAGADGDAYDDSQSLSITPVVPAAGKVVVTEEGTGTWCQWCVRGAVFMDRMSEKYTDYWAGIAVHNGDPMTVEVYDTGIGALIGGYPTALTDRGPEEDPSEMEASILERIQVAPTAILTNGATYDAATRILKVSVSANFLTNANNSYKIACVLTEDGVTGTGSGYNQANAYAGGGQGEMGGYELLPSSVPASQMVYDHVARAIAPSFAGTNECLPATIASGETHVIQFEYVLTAGWDTSKMHIVSMLYDPIGRIDNGGKETIASAIANGLVAGCNESTTQLIENQVDAVFSVYPNPTSSNALVTIQLKEEAKVALKISDLSGKEIAQQNYGSLSGASNLQINTSNFKAGVYLIELSIDNEKMTKRLVVE